MRGEVDADLRAFFPKSSHFSIELTPVWDEGEAALSLEACSLRSLPDSTKWVGSSPRLERCDVEITSGGVVRQPDVRRLWELEIARRMPDSKIQPGLRGLMPGLNMTTVRHFLHWLRRALSWTRSHADCC